MSAIFHAEADCEIISSRLFYHWSLLRNNTKPDQAMLFQVTAAGNAPSINYKREKDAD